MDEEEIQEYRLALDAERPPRLDNIDDGSIPSKLDYMESLNGDWSWKPDRPFPRKTYKGNMPYREWDKTVTHAIA
jgi:hypothetical protein